MCSNNEKYEKVHILKRLKRAENCTKGRNSAVLHETIERGKSPCYITGNTETGFCFHGRSPVMMKEVIPLYERKIRLNGSDDASKFVKAAAECDFNVDVCYNRIVVDGKSILGVLGLDLTRELTVRYGGLDPKFEKVLAEFASAE